MSRNKNKMKYFLQYICHQSLQQLQVSGDQLMENDASGTSSIGTYLGWAMTFIYLGGRMPQIFLNVSYILTFR